MEIRPELAAVMAAVTLLLFVFLYLAYRWAWFRWHCARPHLVTRSPHVHHRLLLAFRLVSFGYCFGVLLYATIQKEGENFKFYTTWNYASLVTFFALATAHSIQMLGREDCPRGPPTLLGRAVWVLFQLNITMVFVVDVILWGVLYPMAKKSDFSKGQSESDILGFVSYNVHGTNCLFMLAELCLNHMRVVPGHSLFLVSQSLIYAFVQWTIKGADPSYVYPYPFLDTSKSTASFWYLGMLALHLLFFLMVFGLAKLRDCLRGRYGIPVDFDDGTEEEQLLDEAEPAFEKPKAGYTEHDPLL
ncbi:hypothetical protein QOT17_005558 [Balamuthia mandrillaris]